jgi:hypothetical protein
MDGVPVAGRAALAVVTVRRTACTGVALLRGPIPCLRLRCCGALLLRRCLYRCCGFFHPFTLLPCRRQPRWWRLAAGGRGLYAAYRALTFVVLVSFAFACGGPGRLSYVNRQRPCTQRCAAVLSWCGRISGLLPCCCGWSQKTAASVFAPVYSAFSAAHSWTCLHLSLYPL